MILSRKKDQRIIINGNIIVTVTAIRRGQVWIGIDAPDDVKIVRQELLDRHREVVAGG